MFTGGVYGNTIFDIGPNGAFRRAFLVTIRSIRMFSFKKNFTHFEIPTHTIHVWYTKLYLHVLFIYLYIHGKCRYLYIYIYMYRTWIVWAMNPSLVPTSCQADPNDLLVGLGMSWQSL